MLVSEISVFEHAEPRKLVELIRQRPACSVAIIIEIIDRGEVDTYLIDQLKKKMNDYNLNTHKWKAKNPQPQGESEAETL